LTFQERLQLHQPTTQQDGCNGGYIEKILALLVYQ